MRTTCVLSEKRDTRRAAGKNLYITGAAALIVVLMCAAARAEAAIILSPVAGVASSEFGPFHDIGNTFDQSGLNIGFVSGTTNFDAYISANPRHTVQDVNTEWFTTSGTTSATITYDLGALFLVDRLAVWNEEFAGFGSATVLFSLNNVTFVPVATGLTPTDHPLSATGTETYPADVFSLTPLAARFIRLELTGCPQPLGGGADFCSAGEVAFSVNTASTAVPEPASIWLLGAGLFAFTLLRRRRL